MRRFAPLAAALAAAAVPAAAAAQAPAAPAPAAPGVTIADVVRGALAGNPQIQISARLADVARGGAIAASGAFDPQLKTSLSNTRDNQLLSATPASVQWMVQDQVTYAAGVEKQLRSGFIVSPGISVSRTNQDVAKAVPTSNASANLAVVMPLLKNRWGAVSAAPERAAEIDAEAGVLDLRHATASGAYDAAVAYWNYLAARRRLDVYAAAEQRAARLASETEQLVRAEERPASDMKQLYANLAAKRSARLGAAQSLVESRQQVGLVMGLRPELIAALPDPATPFPAIDAGATTAEPPPDDANSGGGEIAALADSALRRRPDLAAAQLRLQSALVQRGAAEGDLRARLDLQVGVGYVGLQPGTSSEQFFSPLYRNTSGLNAQVQLRYQLPVTNATARGRLLQTEAAYERQRIAERDAERRIASGVAVALEALRTSRLALAEAERAVSLSQETVDNEKQKFQLGTTTLFDIINAEDLLTNAQLTAIAGQRGYAVAIATLRFTTGTLVEAAAPAAASGAAASVRPERLTTPP